MIQKEVEEVFPDQIMASTNWTGSMVERFKVAYTEVTGNSPPETDNLGIVVTSRGVLINAFNKGCLTAWALIPAQLYSEIRAKMEERRAQN